MNIRKPVETRSVDRTATYYANAAEHIAADPLGFYTRAERGRRYQADPLGREYEREAMATSQEEFTF